MALILSGWGGVIFILNPGFLACKNKNTRSKRVGYALLMLNEWKGEMNNSTKQEFINAATHLNVPLAAIQAVTEVESTGAGFLSDGRPKILFERHKFYQLLTLKKLNTSGLPIDIVNPSAGGYATGPTPDARGIAEHARLDRAAKIERESALCACSWGAFQIMGYHWKQLNYTTLQQFINAMYKNEACQLDAFVRFIKANPNLLSALRKQDWAAFAKGYNGPNYTENKYDQKMAAAYKKALAMS